MGRRTRPNLSLGEKAWVKKLVGNHWSKDTRAPFILEVRFPGLPGQQSGVSSPGDWCLSQQWKDGGLWVDKGHGQIIQYQYRECIGVCVWKFRDSIMARIVTIEVGITRNPDKITQVDPQLTVMVWAGSQEEAEVTAEPLLLFSFQQWTILES